MPNSRGNSNRGKLTITATEAGIKTAERALIRLGFGTKTNFAKSHYISRSTVTKFFGRKPIQPDTFEKICQELKLNWREIAAIEEETMELKIDSRSSLTANGRGKKMVISSSRQVTVIESSTGTIKAEITLMGDINSVSNLNIVGEILREYSGNIIKIQDIQKGRSKITLEDPREDIEKNVIPIKPGDLNQINTFPVENSQILTEDLEEGESNGLYNKWGLAKEIVEYPTFDRILDGVDLSDADLSKASLSGTHLSNANLSHADLMGANLIGANLSHADLSHADLSHADLRSANLSHADLMGANLSHADLSKANLNGTYLWHANLSKANLNGTYLRHANLIDANVKGTKFGYNEEISKSMKCDLILRGAIF